MPDAPVVPGDTAGTERGADRPDDVTEPQLHAIHAIASDGEDHHLDEDGSIARSVLAFNTWLGAQTGGPKLRLDLARDPVRG